MDHRTWISIRAKRDNYFRGFILYSCDWSIFKQKLPPYSHKLSLNFITEALINAFKPGSNNVKEI